MLRHKVLGAEILDNRKALAFAGFTHKAPRPVTYARLSRLYPQAEEREQEREQREPGARNGDSTIRRSRALSM
jgi:protein-serine/threonine kinase